MTCTKPNARPVKITDEMAAIAAVKTAAELIVGANFELDEKDDIARDILTATQHDRNPDGYMLACTLERICHWSPDADTVDILNGFGLKCRDELLRAEKAWGVENPMLPPFPLGTVLTVKGQDGVIEDIQLFGPAKYAVRLLHDTRRIRIINFEDAIPKETTP